MTQVVVPHEKRSTITVTFQLDVSQSYAERLKAMGRLVAVRGRSADVTAGQLWEAYRGVLKYHPDEMGAQEQVALGPAPASAA